MQMMAFPLLGGIRFPSFLKSPSSWSRLELWRGAVSSNQQGSGAELMKGTWWLRDEVKCTGLLAIFGVPESRCGGDEIARANCDFPCQELDFRSSQSLVASSSIWILHPFQAFCTRSVLDLLELVIRHRLNGRLCRSARVDEGRASQRVFRTGRNATPSDLNRHPISDRVDGCASSPCLKRACRLAKICI